MNIPKSSQVTRRRFLTQAGIGLAAISTLNLASAQVTAAKKVRVGIIGCGKRGKWLGGLFNEHGGYEVVAAADYFEDAVAEAAALFKLAPGQTFTGLKCHEKMIAKGGLDAVAIVSPPYFHPEQAQAAVAAGLHVYLSKPVAVDVPGCQSIAASGAAARKAGLIFFVDFQTRANAFFVEALRRVHDGALGDIAFGEGMFHADRLDIKAPPGGPEARLRNWVFDQALSGDIIVEQNIHTLDVMSWIMKETPPLRCSGTGGRRVRVDVGDCWDYYTLVYEYANNVGVTYSSRQFNAHGTPFSFSNRMFGSKGVLNTAYGGDVLIRGGAESFYRGGKTGGIYKEGVETNLRTFHNQVLRRDATNPTIESSITSNLIAIMGRMAAQGGRTVTWDEVLASTHKIQPDLSGLRA